MFNSQDIALKKNFAFVHVNTRHKYTLCLFILVRNVIHNDKCRSTVSFSLVKSINRMHIENCRAVRISVEYAVQKLYQTTPIWLLTSVHGRTTRSDIFFGEQFLLHLLITRKFQRVGIFLHQSSSNCKVDEELFCPIKSILQLHFLVSLSVITLRITL